MRRTGFLSVVGFASVAALAACATASQVTYSKVNPPPHAFGRRDAASVDVFVGSPPARPHVDVGLFEVEQGMEDNGVGHSTEHMIATLRFHAGLRGCDAVHVMNVDREVLGSRKHVYSRRVVRGVCQMYTDAPATQAVAPPPLPGEGKACTLQEDTPPCPDPLICSNKICTSPYQ